MGKTTEIDLATSPSYNSSSEVNPTQQSVSERILEGRSGLSKVRGKGRDDVLPKIV